jgi:hypothetical protein
MSPEPEGRLDGLILDSNGCVDSFLDFREVIVSVSSKKRL